MRLNITTDCIKLKPMNNSKIYIVLFALSLLLFGCKKPAPTELIQDNSNANDPLQVEVITKDIGDVFYSNGFDTTGIADNLLDYGNVVIVGGIKFTRNSQTVQASLAQAIFFDKNIPIYSRGGRLIGYVTRTPGDVYFDDIQAKKVPYRIGFNNMGMISDTTLGFRYVIAGRKGFGHGVGGGNPFEFKYGSSIKFKFAPMMGMGNITSFDIPTPKEITGNVKISGHLSDKSLDVDLEWNKENDQNIEIVLGAVNIVDQATFPLFRITTQDDGKVHIPRKLINGLPQNTFSKLVFTFIRKYRIHNTDNGHDITVLSESSHSITIDIP